MIINHRKLFNLYLECDTWRRVDKMDFADDILTSNDVVDWTDKAHPKHRKLPETANRLELGYEIDSNDAYLKPVLAEIDIYTTPETTITKGGTVVPIKSRLSTLMTDAATGRAITKQPGISPNNKDAKNTPFQNCCSGMGS